MDNFIGISREIIDHWIYKDSQYFHVWFEMLRCARYSKEPKNDIDGGVSYTINYAEFMFGYPSWSKRLKVGEQRLRTLIKLLIKDKMIVQIKKHPKFTIYFIVNYEKYNNLTNNQQGQQTSGIEGNVNNQANKQLTSSQQPPNNLLTTKEEGSKKDKKVKKDEIKKPSTDIKPSADNRQVSDYFCQIHKEKTGIDYLFQGGKDGKALSTLLKTYDVEFMKAFIDWYFGTKDEFICKVGREISKMPGVAAKFISEKNTQNKRQTTGNPFLDKLKEMQNEQN